MNTETTLNGKVVTKDGDEFWYKEGKLHRTDGPAVIYDDGSEFWYKEGELHRTDGPAVIWDDGPEEYWVNDVKMTKEETYQTIRLDKTGMCY